MTNVQADEAVTVTVVIRTSFGRHRPGQWVDVAPDVAAGWMSAKLADLVVVELDGEPVFMQAPETNPDKIGFVKVADGKAVEGGETAGRVGRARQPRGGKTDRDAVGNRARHGSDAADTEPVEGADAGRHGASEG